MITPEVYYRIECDECRRVLGDADCDGLVLGTDRKHATQLATDYDWIVTEFGRVTCDTCAGRTGENK